MKKQYIVFNHNKEVSRFEHYQDARMFLDEIFEEEYANDPCCFGFYINFNDEIANDYSCRIYAYISVVEV